MRVIGVDKNGDEIAEVSVTELDTMFKEVRNKAIDEFTERLSEKIKYEIDDCAEELDWIDEIAEQLKGGSDDGK